jgi:transposase-like protein
VAPPSKYSPEFREEAVQIALRSSKTISETARELELNPETLRGWVKKHEKRVGGFCSQSPVKPRSAVLARSDPRPWRT